MTLYNLKKLAFFVAISAGCAQLAKNNSFLTLKNLAEGNKDDRPQHLQVCENQPVPADYVITSRDITSVNNRCGNWRSGPNSWQPYTENELTKIGAVKMRICDDQNIPPGYQVTQRNLASVRCGMWRSSLLEWKPYTELEITKLTR